MKKLLEVQKQIGTLSKNSKNPFFKSQYLDLTTLIEHVTPLLNEQGLVLLQPLAGDTVTSAIMDSETGEVIASSSLTLPNQQDPQKLGSAITYFRRYTLKSLLAIAEVDDDGNLANKVNSKVEEPSLEELSLRGCKTLKELQQVYTSLSKQEQVKHVALKDELKIKLK
jgi:hypothetical protein